MLLNSYCCAWWIADACFSSARCNLHDWMLSGWKWLVTQATNIQTFVYISMGIFAALKSCMNSGSRPAIQCYSCQHTLASLILMKRTSEEQPGEDWIKHQLIKPLFISLKVVQKKRVYVNEVAKTRNSNLVPSKNKDISDIRSSLQPN